MLHHRLPQLITDSISSQLDPALPFLPSFISKRLCTLGAVGVPILKMYTADYYKILEVDYDASEEDIRSNYIRLALKWHPDKRKEHDGATSRFQEINEAYQVLSDPVKRQEYHTQGLIHVWECNAKEYLNCYKGLILTCNGLGMRHSLW